MSATYTVRKEPLGWTVTDHRAEPGSRQHYLDTFPAAIATLERLELEHLAGEQWHVSRPVATRRVFLVRRGPGPLRGQVAGQTLPFHDDQQAIAYLLAQHAKDAQRATTRLQRDRLRIAADVALDEASRLDAALATDCAA